MGLLLVPEAGVKSAFKGIDIIGWHQTDDYSCGYAASVTLLKHFGIRFTNYELWNELAPCPDNGITTAAVLKALRIRGLVVSRKLLTAKTLKEAYAANLPTLTRARLDFQSTYEEHWMIAAAFSGGHSLLLNQPDMRNTRTWWSIKKLRRRSDSVCWVVRQR